ncbi:MAG: tetratricopeptide repeat protein [Candidatus Aenigmarchaeota archaeon]|nr:tetratricopeptide repeat protein [Candidatus Aenigmarchaeota archaeon]
MPSIIALTARSLRKSNRSRKALEYLTSVIDTESDDIEARFELEHLLYEVGNIEEAVKQNEEILKRDPNFAESWFNLGWIYATSKGNVHKGIEYLQRALGIHPKNPGYLYTLGCFYQINDTRHEARDAFTRCISNSPDEPIRRDAERRLAMLQ